MKSASASTNIPAKGARLLQDFAGKVENIATNAPSEWCFGDKVYVCYVIARLIAAQPFATPDSIKELLRRAHSERMVVLAQADLVQVMRQDALRDSEVMRGLTVYHFVRRFSLLVTAFNPKTKHTMYQAGVIWVESVDLALRYKTMNAARGGAGMGIPMQGYNVMIVVDRTDESIVC